MNERMIAQRKKRMMQGVETNSTPVNAVPSLVHDVLDSPGQHLDEGTRAFMEPRFGHDFSQVSIHADEESATAARNINATAYTLGQDIVFGSGEYAPETDTGRYLLAHELAHVVQQSRRGHQTPPPIPTHPLEQAAQQVASIVASGGTAHVEGASAPGIARQPRSLDQSLDPTKMWDADLAQEIALIRQWLADNPVNSPENDQLTNTLAEMETEVMQRNGRPNQADAGAEQLSYMGVETTETSVPALVDTSTPSASLGRGRTESVLSESFPSFTKDLAKFPILIAPIMMPGFSVFLELHLLGSVTVTFQNSIEGISIDVDSGAFEAEAGRTVNGIFQGIQINRIDAKEVSFGATVGTKFAKAAVEHIGPYTWEFTGQVLLPTTVDTRFGPVAVLGDPGYKLVATMIPLPSAPQEEEPVDWDKVWEIAVPIVLIGSGVGLAAAAGEGLAGLVAGGGLAAAR
jgi:hypothetical protein